MRAASGSNQKLNSAGSEALPGTRILPPMKTMPLDLGFDVRLQAQRQRHVGHGPDRQNGHLARMALDLGDQELHRVRGAACGR